jgi:hypothetical protein
VRYAGWHVSTIAKITLGGDPRAFQVLPNAPRRTNHDAHPTANAAALITDDRSRLLIAMHRSRDAGLQAARLQTLATLQGKREGAALLYHDTGHDSRLFRLERFDDIA